MESNGSREAKPGRPKLPWKPALAVFSLFLGCQKESASTAGAAVSAASAAASAAIKQVEAAPGPRPVMKVEERATGMGTSIHLIAYTTDTLDESRTREALLAAIREMNRLEALLSEWREDSDIGRVNRESGAWVEVSPEATEVLERALWAGRASAGTFDITFQGLSGLWKFGSAQEAHPRVPSAHSIALGLRSVDYRKVELDSAARRVRIGKGQAIGLGGIAKGYIVDRAVRVLRGAGLRAFLVQAGGDLYGAGRKPDGSRWVSGIQDPRGKPGDFFATLELEDHAFSTAGDYARAYVVDGKRYHHIIDPRTGYPARASRSVTVWASDATTADLVDDAVFILGGREGLDLANTTAGVGVVIVDAGNRVTVSERLEGHVKVLRQPSPGI